MAGQAQSRFDSSKSLNKATMILYDCHVPLESGPKACICKPYLVAMAVVLACQGRGGALGSANPEFGADLEGHLMFATPAYAQAAGGGAAAGLGSLIPIILIFGIMYFLMIRPQQKKMKEHREMVDALKRGDQVVTQGGLIGKITKVKEDSEVEVEIADGVKVRVIQSTIVNVLNKTEPRES